MKKLKSLLFGLGAIALLGACSNDRDTYEGRDPSGKNDVTFNTNISSRAVGRAIDSDWTSGDAIGIYAVKAGTGLSEADIFDGKSNIKHTTTSAGKTAKFVAANPAQAIALDGKTEIDVIAYYPFTTPITDFSLAVDVNDQSKPQDIDVLYSNNLKNVEKAGPANMTFSHQLSKLIFIVEPTADYPSLAGLGAKDLQGLINKGSFDLKTGAITLSGDATMLQPKVNGSSVSAILIPGQKLGSNVSVKFTLGAEEFTWTSKKEFDLAAGTKYTFRIQLSKDGSVATLNPEGGIEDWVEGNDDNGVDIITPGGEDPDPKPTEGNDLTADKSMLNFTKDASALALNITSSLAWTITSDAAWLSVDVTSGNGNKTINVQTLANTGNARSAKLTITGGQKVIVVTVNQAAGTSQPGVEQVVFLETFGKSSKVAKPWPLISAYTNFDNKNLVFKNTDSAGKTDIRSTSKLDNHAWLPEKGGNLVIEGFDLTGFSDVQLEFAVTTNLFNAGSEFDLGNINVFCDDTKVAVPSFVITKADGYFEKFYVVKLTGLPSNFSSLKFTVDNNTGTRITDIKLSGKK